MHGTEAELRPRIAALKAKGFPGITQLQIHIVMVKPARSAKAALNFTVSDDFLRDVGVDLRDHGILFQALPYTSDMAACEKLFDLGVALIATDYPAAVVREIRDHYARGVDTR